MAAQLVEVLITGVEFPEGQPNGVALALMARTKRPGIKVLFVGGVETREHTEGVGELLVTPVLAADVMERAEKMLAKRG